MAQGIPRKKEEVIEVLRPYFQLGCSVHKACNYAGLPQSTVQTWIDADDDLRSKIVGWQNEINAKARANWRARVASGDYQASKEWLERYPDERKDFSPRSEVDVTTNGESLNELTDDQLERVVNRRNEPNT